MNKIKGYKHVWVWDWPWHMVNLRDWFYMVNVGFFGLMHLHVRVLGLRSLWTFESQELGMSKNFDEAKENILNYTPPLLDACVPFKYDLAVAYADFAALLNKPVEELTSIEKQQALLNHILEKADAQSK